MSECTYLDSASPASVPPLGFLCFFLAVGKLWVRVSRAVLGGTSAGAILSSKSGKSKSLATVAKSYVVAFVQGPLGSKYAACTSPMNLVCRVSLGLSINHIKISYVDRLSTLRVLEFYLA